jgi:RHS repeat-associated protein
LRSISALHFLVLTSLFAAPHRVDAQVPGSSAGLPAHGTYSGGPDAINLGNLNIHIEIPIFSKPGRGIPYHYSLIYDSSIYQSQGFWWPNNSATYGWASDQFGMSSGYVTSQSWVYDSCPYSGDPDDSYNSVYALTVSAYHSPDGVIHTFPAGISTFNACDGLSTPYTAASSDGYTITVSASGNGGTIALTDPSGTTFGVDANSGVVDGSPITDTNGNTFPSSAYYHANSGTSITYGYGDTTGLNPILYTYDPTTTLTHSVQYTDSNGVQQTVNLNYTQMIVATAFGVPGIDEYSLNFPPTIYPYGPIYKPLLTSVVYPDGSSYSFTYEQTPGESCCTTGRIASMTLPTGGTISYQYTGGYNGIFADGTTSGLVRTTTDGQTTYTRFNVVAPGYTTPGSSTTTVQDALGNQTVLTFVEQSQQSNYNFYETSRISYAGAAGGTVLESGATCYNGTMPPCTTTPVTLPFTQIYRSESSDGSANRATKTIYNSYGLVQEVDSYDYGASAPSFRAVTSYASLGGNILNRPSSVVLYDSSNSIVSQTSYGYDESDKCTLATTSGLPGHYGASVRGNRTSVNRWVHIPNSSVPDSWVTTHTCFDDAGQVRKVFDGNGSATSYTYDSATDTFVTDTLMPTPSSGVTIATQATFDLNTGLQTSSTDENGHTTTYSYDAMMRPSLITYPSTTAGQAKTTYSYPSFVHTSVSKLMSSTQSTDAETVVDGYGRIIQKATYMGSSSSPAYSQVDTCYDVLGRVHFTSYPYLGSGVPSTPICSGAGDTYGYDQLSRLSTVTHPDGATQTTAHTWSSAGAIVDSWDEALNHSQRIVDGFGRLKTVFEPDPTSNAPSIETDYSYDGLSNLASVTQWGGASGSTGARIRTSVYDSISLLITATNPESGTICYGQWSGSNCVNGYDGNGNLLYKTDARGIASQNTYDVLNRLLHVTFTDGTPGKDFSNDGVANVWGQTQSNGVGRLTWAQATDTYEQMIWNYDAMGRITTQEVCLPSNCWHTQYTINAGYDLAGDMTDLTYPDGQHIKQTFSNAGQTLTSNLVDVTGTAIASYLQGISYFADGSPSQVTLGNGVVQTITKNNRMQVQNVTAWTPLEPFTGQPFLSHTYCYSSCTTGGTANNGNIWGITDTLNAAKTQGYTYDKLNRIRSFSTGGTPNQSYGIDSFGNMTQMAGSSPVNTFDPSTNRINNLPCAVSLTPFDAAGNQLCDTDANGGIRQYGIDAESRIAQISMLGSGTPFVSYIYDAAGNRVRKNNADSTFTEYVYFGGRPIAQKDQAGTWTDHIYANGKKIAQITSADTRYHLTGVNGTTTDTGRWTVGLLPIPSGITFQTGDILSYSIYQHNAAAGITMAFTDGSNSDWYNNGWKGASIQSDTWVNLSFSLNGPMAGKTMNQFQLGNYQGGPNGEFDVMIADIAITHADGTVTQIPIPLGSYSWGGDTTAVSSVSFVGEQVGATSGQVGAIAQTHYYISDHLNTAQMEFAAGGWPVWKGEFSPFGQEINPQLTSNQYKFTGKERDTESGNDYFGARYLSSTNGRWMSPDWSASPQAVPYASLADPQSLNLYSYVGNSPLTRRDADGHLYLGDDPYGGDVSGDTASLGSSGRFSLLRANAAQTEAQYAQYVVALSNTIAVQQQQNSSGGLSIWQHLGNIFHGRPWDYRRTYVTSRLVLPDDADEGVALTMDATGFLIAIPRVLPGVPGIVAGACVADVSVNNDRSKLNLGLNAGGQVFGMMGTAAEGSAVATAGTVGAFGLAYGSISWDLINGFVNKGLIPMAGQVNYDPNAPPRTGPTVDYDADTD